MPWRKSGSTKRALTKPSRSTTTVAGLGRNHAISLEPLEIDAKAEIGLLIFSPTGGSTPCTKMRQPPPRSRVPLGPVPPRDGTLVRIQRHLLERLVEGKR